MSGHNEACDPNAALDTKFKVKLINMPNIKGKISFLNVYQNNNVLCSIKIKYSFIFYKMKNYIFN